MPRPTFDARAVPRIPLFRVILALALVPGVYLTLLATALAALAVGFAAGYGVYWLVQEMHRIHYRLILIAGVAALGALTAAFAIVRGIVRSLAQPPHRVVGLRLTRVDEPAIHQLVGEVCADLGCEPPNIVAILLEPNCFATMGRMRLLDGAFRGRVMGIGAPYLNFLTVEELRGVIAHEMAHFTGGDVLYSQVVLPVYVGTGEALEGLTESAQPEQGEGFSFGGCLFALPMWVPIGVLRAYRWAFALLDASISRARELRADAIASLVVGREPTAAGLRRSDVGAPLFGQLVREAARAGGTAPAGVFESFRMRLAEAADAQPRPGEQTEQTRDPFATHPKTAARIAALPDAPRRKPDERLSRELLSDPERYEQALLSVLRGPSGPVRG